MAHDLHGNACFRSKTWSRRVVDYGQCLVLARSCQMNPRGSWSRHIASISITEWQWSCHAWSMIRLLRPRKRFFLWLTMVLFLRTSRNATTPLAVLVFPEPLSCCSTLCISVSDLYPFYIPLGYHCWEEGKSAFLCLGISVGLTGSPLVVSYGC